MAKDIPEFAEAEEARLRQLDGWFAIAGVQADGSVSLITDRLGEFHIYTARKRQCLLISTSSLVLSALTDASWDPAGCRQFLATGVIFEPSRTLFQNVEKLGPAMLYSFSAGRVTSKKYWDLASVLQRRTDSPGDLTELASALRDAVTTISANFSHSVFDLTGGFDTRGLLGAALQTEHQFDFVVNGSANDPDVLASTRIARDFGLRHRHLWSGFESAAQWWRRAKQSLALVDGEQDILYYAHIYEVHDRLARDFDASVNGNVGEICQGHWWEVCLPFLGSRRGVDARLIASRRVVADGEVPNLLACDFPEHLVDYFTRIVRQENAGLQGQPNVAYMDNIYLALWEQRFYGRTISATSQIWPVISPYAFGSALEAAVSVPWQHRVRRRLSRRLINYQSPKLAALPVAQGGPALPLQLTTAHLFLPLVAEYAPIVLRRLALGLGIQFAPGKPPKNGNASPTRATR